LQRRIHYEQEQGFPPGSVPVQVPGTAPYPPPYAAGAPSDDFRGRFQRVMTVPAPFRSNFNNANGSGAGEGGGATTPSSASGDVEAIDPHLGAKEVKGEA
jgi:hypothetical protein